MRKDEQRKDGNVGPGGLTRRQLLAAGAGVAAGAGFVGSGRLAPADAASTAVATKDASSAPLFLAITMVIVGQRQGQFKGRKGGVITVLALSHELVTPYDAASGRPTGGRVHKPLNITKEVDSASPQLLVAASTSETLTTVQITARKAGGGGKEIPYLQITLSNALIVSSTEYVSDTEAAHNIAYGGMRLIEDISFTYQKIEVKHLIGKTTYADEWQTPS